MKNIMFNDMYGLTKAVLDGSKTMTRRIVPQKTIDKYALLIDRISGKGTWASNPYVFVYEFELVD